MSGGGSEPNQVGTTTTVNTSEPWAGVRSHLTDTYSQAQDLSQNPLQFFPDQTFVNFSPETEQALSGIASRATTGSPAVQQSQNMLAQTAQGNFLNANPHLDAMYDRASRGLVRNYQEAIAPSIDAQATRAGRYGSNLYANMHGAAQDNLSRAMGELATDIYGRNYQMERENQIKGAALAPTLAQMDYYDLQQLQGAGTQREALAEAGLADRINRFEFEQNEPWQNLGRYAQFLGSGTGFGSSTTTQPIYRSGSTGSNVLGGALSGAGLGSMFGPWGLAGGAALGGIGSFLFS